ncbi:histidine kinase [Flavobacterium longum]|uniref:response regulator n=1 Tax=Flavobacterium longum TaxID=1299340 RepID=UPI0039EC6461
MNGNFKRNLLLSSGASLLILIISSTASYLSIKNLIDTNAMVNHTQEVIYNVNETQAVIVDAQTGMRGYLITGKRTFLDKRTGAEAKTAEFLDKLERLTLDNPAQQVTIKEIRPLAYSFFRYLEKRIEDKDLEKSVTVFDLDRGKQLSDELRILFKRMETRENELLHLRTEEARQYGSYGSILILVAALIAVIISSVFFFRILADYRTRLNLQLELEDKDRETAERIRVISNIAQQISSGNYNVRVDDTESDALGSVAGSLNNMAVALDESFAKLSDNEWLQSGVAQLNKAMLGEKSVHELAQSVVDFLAKYTDSQAGVLYLLEDGGLQFAAGYSYQSNERKQIQPGEGLSGQAVASGQLLELRMPDDDSIRVSFALGEAKPTHVVALPLEDNGITGVVELGTVNHYSSREINFLAAVSNNIGIAFRAAQNRRRIQELLEETQSQSEELKAQHTELEGMNAELEAQTEKLQASEEELKVQQEELQQTNEELAERSVLLEEQNVEIQKKSEALELSTRYKSEFLANMSHELRTPLNSILLLSRLLGENNEKNLTDEQVEFAKVIQSSGTGLLGLIDEILDLSKIEAGKMELEIVDVPTEEIVQTMRNLFALMAQEKGIGFEIDTTQAPLVIMTDRMRLEQILKNLISNAIKFTSAGAVTVTIARHPDSDKLVSFAVTDTGIGIPAAQQPLIFEAFQQADGSTKRKYGGTGLGLSISRELARLLKGEITLESEPDKGSTFTLTIPIAASVAGSVTKDGEKSATGSSRKFISATIPDAVPDDRNDISANDKVILIVEDDTNFAKSLLEFTRERGYKGVVSVRGDEAFRMAQTFGPTGILLDIELPVKSGWEVMDELKSDAMTRHIPVHIMSSHKARQESLLKGAVNFLDKPVAFEQIPEVFQRIEHIVNRESQKVLIVEDNSKHAQALSFFLDNNNIQSEISSDIAQSIETLQKDGVDCVILDMGIPDKQAYEILDGIKRDAGLEHIPVIVFTGKSLSMNEEMKIKKYADSIVVKTAHSYQRMLDEVSLFLHIVEDKKHQPKRADHKKQLDNVLKDKTVLVVDDDVRNIYSLTKALELLQMKVITAIDGAEALKALDAHPQTDVVLLDMMMPNMDGYETAKRIRQDKKLKKLPVIAVTAKAMTGDREKCINAGASDYITKPVDVDQLLSLLRVWLYDSQK